MTFLLTKAPTEPGRTLEAHFLSKHEEFAQKYGIGLIRVVNMGYRSVPWVPVFVGSVESLQLFFPAWGFRNGLKALFLFPAWGSLDLNKCNSSACGHQWTRAISTALDGSMPGHEHIEYQKKGQMECQSICQKECQNMYMPFILPDDVSENHSKTNPVGDEILVEILVWTAWYLADSTRLRPASRVQHHSGVLGAAATHAGEAGFTVWWPYPRKILFELSINRLWYFFQISIIKLWLIWFDLIGWLIDKGRPSSHWRCNQQYSGDQDWTQDKDWTHGSSWAILRLRVLTALKSRINWKVCRRFKRQPVHLLRSCRMDLLWLGALQFLVVTALKSKTWKVSSRFKQLSLLLLQSLQMGQLSLGGQIQEVTAPNSRRWTEERQLVGWFGRSSNGSLCRKDQTETGDGNLWQGM